MNKNNNGAILVFLGATAFSLGGLFVKLIDWSPIAINAGRCIFSSLIISLYMYISKHKLKINKTVILGAVFVNLMLLCYVTSTKLTSAANAIVLEYTAPIFVIIFETLFFKRKLKILDMIACTFVFGGICIVVLNNGLNGNIIGDFIAVLSGIFYALTIMLNEFKDGDSFSSVLLGHISTAIIGLPFIFQETNFDTNTILLVISLGVFQAGLGYTLLTVGLKKCDPVMGSLIASIEPVLNPILVALFYKEYVSVQTIIGSIIVIGTIVVYNVLNMRYGNNE